MPVLLFGVSPAGIAEPATPGGPDFALYCPGWRLIRRYTSQALALPTTERTLRDSFGPDAPSDLSDFQRLIEAYLSINSHAKVWDRTSYPAIVGLASDVYQFGAVKAKTFYPAILKEASILRIDPDNAQAKAALQAVLTTLGTAAQTLADKAETVVGQLREFGSQTAADRLVLIGTNDRAGLTEYYNDRYGPGGPESFSGYGLAELDVDLANAQLGTALAAIFKVQQAWAGIGATLTTAAGLLAGSVANALPVIANLDVDKAVFGWQDVAAVADDFRTHAFQTRDELASSPV
ncbi:MAG: HBL/NHE enterotoxin family protein [Actinomycetota bacterium]|nr:HBL/NHE enterotoxin family protein [Actinomycetota bacterium]MDQ2955479.1 HBL/NHE enterotoxin family protein [Actinomycetota bacterium]